MIFQTSRHHIPHILCIHSSLSFDCCCIFHVCYYFPYPVLICKLSLQKRSKKSVHHLHPRQNTHHQKGHEAWSSSLTIITTLAVLWKIIRCCTFFKEMCPRHWCQGRSSFSAGERLVFQSETTGTAMQTSSFFGALRPIDTGSFDWMLFGAYILPLFLLPLIQLKVSPSSCMVTVSPLYCCNSAVRLRRWILLVGT